MNTRVQLEFSEVKIKELERLMREMGLTTRKDLFNNALTLLKWAAAEKRSGRTIASIDNATHSYKELLMPALAEIAASRDEAADGVDDGESRLPKVGAARANSQ